MLIFMRAAIPVALVLCCALPILLVSGVTVGGGILLGKTVLVLIGLGGITYGVYRVTQRLRGG